VPEGVYIIYNAAKTLILQVPIYSDTTALWVTPNPNVDPMRMPSYQWVVKHTSTSEKNSPITIYNREFPNEKVTIRNIVLYSDENTTIRGGVEINRNSFVPVGKDILKNQNLGYYYIKPEDAKISKFDLNYFNQFLGSQQTFFINKTAKDSTLEVNDAERKMQFKFHPMSSAPKTYGYVPSLKEVEDLGIDTLKRVAYKLTTIVDDVEKLLVINKEHRYALDNANANVQDTAVFLFKANNFAKNIDGELVDFFALLDTTSKSSFLPNYPIYGRTSDKDSTYGKGLNYDLRYVKLGVPDDTRWIYEQVQTEQRTSAFAVTSYTPPLYRRFDGGTYKAYQYETTPAVEPINADVKGTKNANKPVWLKFARVNNFGYEYLAENSPRTAADDKANNPIRDYRDDLSTYGQYNTSFLALHNSAQLAEKEKEMSYTFYVDTAYSERPAIGSTSGKFTPKPQYMLALRAQTYEEDWIEHITGGGGYWINSNGDTIRIDDPNASKQRFYIPAATVGEYLYNATDSVNLGKKDFLGKYGYGGNNTTRLAFVRGVHLLKSDSFIVIPNGVYNNVDYKAKSDLTLLQEIETIKKNLPAELQHYLGVNDHYVGRRDADGKPVYVDGKSANGFVNGKAMVFQFRLVPDAKGERNFIIETTTKDSQYGPDKAQWIRIENGVPFITPATSFNNATEHSGADIFTVELGDTPAPGEPGATANEAAQLSDAARVISGVNQISILNAAGKTVTVTNVLGQTVAKTVATSDNATITLPKGIVVVSVDGKSTKAVVK
jgi:hypothetical protein